MSLNVLAIMINLLFIYSVHSLIYSLHALHLYHVPRTMQNIKTPELSVIDCLTETKKEKKEKFCGSFGSKLLFQFYFFLNFTLCLHFTLLLFYFST